MAGLDRVTPLRLGARITSETGLATGRIGAFARGEDGQLFVLTARHVLIAEPSRRAYLNTSELGEYADLPVLDDDSDEDANDFSAAIAVIRVSDQASPVVIEEAGITVDDYVEDTFELVDEPVRTVSDTDIFSEGIIVSASRRTFVRDGALLKTTIRFSNAIEIRVDREVGFLEKGSAGMPIVDGKGRLVGLLMSRSEQGFFAAAVAPFLKRHGLSLHKTKARPTPRAVFDVETINADLRDVSLNLSEWKHQRDGRDSMFRRTPTGELVLELVDPA